MRLNEKYPITVKGMNNHKNNRELYIKSAFGSSDEKKKTKSVIKIIWGVDKIGCSYIFIKLKDLVSGKYFDKIFIPLYQNKLTNSNKVDERIESIIEFIDKKYETTGQDNSPNSDNSSYRFIKGVTFSNYSSARDFYIHLVKDIIVHGIGANNLDSNIFSNKDNYMLKTGILNFIK